MDNEQDNETAAERATIPGKPVVYVKHPISATVKKAIVSDGHAILDAKFAPPGAPVFDGQTGEEVDLDAVADAVTKTATSPKVTSDTDTAKLNEQIVTLSEEVATLTAQTKEDAGLIDTLKKQLADAGGEDLSEELAGLKESQASLLDQVKADADVINTLKKEAADADKAAKAAAKELAKRDKQIATLEKKVGELTSEA